MSRRILVSSFGSAGDVFPLVPVVERLRALGHDVRCAVPRALGLYLRPRRLPVYGLGRGDELRVLDDDTLVTSRFDGWASWRHTTDRYIAPALAGDVAALEGVVRQWRPDLIVTTTFAAAARLVAERQGIARLELTVYPQHADRLAPQHAEHLAPSRHRFARAYRRRCAELAAVGGREPSGPAVTDLAWATGPGTGLLHDRALLGPGVATGREPLGYPYWDVAPERPGDHDRARAWLAASARPAVLVTLGSFIGTHHVALWREVTTAVAAVGRRALLVGPRPRAGDAGDAADSGASGDSGDVLAVGYLSLSKVVGDVEAVVHHGGIGTTFGVLRAGRPAVVVPQAFDQPFNGRLLARAGAGVVGRPGAIEDALGEVVGTGRAADRARELAGRLLSPARATERAVAHVVERLAAAVGSA